VGCLLPNDDLASKLLSYLNDAELNTKYNAMLSVLTDSKEDLTRDKQLMQAQELLKVFTFIIDKG